MLIERLTERIGRAVQHVQFRNVYGNRFDSPVMRELYAKKMKRDYSLSLLSHRLSNEGGLNLPCLVE